MVIIEENTLISLANSKFLEITGYSRDEIEGKRFWTEFVVPEDRDRMLKYHHGRRGEDTVAPDQYEFRFITGTGEIRSVFVIIGMIPGTKKSVASLLDISGRKRAEEALRESEEKYRLVVEHSQDAIYIHRSDRLLFVNSRASVLTGYTHDELMEIRLWDLVHPDDRDELIKRAGKRFAGEVITSGFTARLLTKDGILRYCEFFVELITFQGAPAILGIARDITERKTAEEALFSSRQMLQAVLDTIPQRVFWKDRNSVFLGGNKPLALDAGFSEPADIIGKTDYDHASSAMAERFRADDRQVMETGRSKINYEEPQVRADGSKAWLRTSKVPLRDKEGTIIGVLGTYEDITERKRAEETLKESEERYRLLITSSFDAVIVHQEGRIVLANAAAAQIFGSASTDGLVGQPVLDFVCPEFQTKVTERVGQMMHSMEKAVPLIEEKFLRNDGTAIDVEVMATATQHGGLPAVMVVFRDITGRKRDEEILRRSEAQLKRAEEVGRSGELGVAAEGKCVQRFRGCTDSLWFRRDAMDR